MMRDVNVDGLLADARSLGCDEVELYLEQLRDTQIVVTRGELLSASTSDIYGAGVRVICDKKMGFVYTSTPDAAGLAQAIAEAKELAAGSEADDGNGLPDPLPVDTDDRYYDPGQGQMSIREKAERLIPLHDRVKAEDPRATGISELMYMDREQEIRVVNTLGMDVRQRRSGTIMTAEVIASQDGESQSAYMFSTGRTLDSMDIDGLVKNGVWEATSVLGAKTIKSTRAPVILSPFVSAQLLMALSEALTAEAVQKGRSMFVSRVGTKVASEKLCIVDDPTMEDGVRSQFFDGEGVRCERKEIVRNGVLESLLYDSFTARKEGRTSSGHGNRLGYRQLPSPGPSNMMLSPEGLSRSELMGMAGSGLFVTQVYGMFSGMDTVGANISFGAGGLWFENGEFQYPVRGVTVASDLHDLLNNVVATGDDLTLYELRGCFGSPSILISECAISGN